jgi:hypothetical protein
VHVTVQVRVALKAGVANGVFKKAKETGKGSDSYKIVVVKASAGFKKLHPLKSIVMAESPTPAPCQDPTLTPAHKSLRGKTFNILLGKLRDVFLLFDPYNHEQVLGLDPGKEPESEIRP